MMESEVKLTVYYVYTLTDPRDNKVFYVGKGKGKRLSRHVKDAINGKIDNVNKYMQIKEIHSNGLKVIEEVVHSNLTESEAYRIEKELIHELRPQGLTNISNGFQTNESLVHEQCKLLRSRVKTYSEWINSIGIEEIKSAIMLNGTTKNFYDKFISDLDELILRTGLQINHG